MNETYFDELRRFNLDVQRIVPLAQDVELMNKRLKELQTECKNVQNGGNLEVDRGRAQKKRRDANSEVAILNEQVDSVNRDCDKLDRALKEKDDAVERVEEQKELYAQALKYMNMKSESSVFKAIFRPGEYIAFKKYLKRLNLSPSGSPEADRVIHEFCNKYNTTESVIRRIDVRKNLLEQLNKKINHFVSLAFESELELNEVDGRQSHLNELKAEIDELERSLSLKNEQFAQVQQGLSFKAKDLRAKFPAVSLLLDVKTDTAEAVKKASSTTIRAPYLLSTKIISASDSSQKYVEWMQGKQGAKENLWICSDKVGSLNRLLWSILCMFPVGKAHITFVDLKMNHTAEQAAFRNQLGSDEVIKNLTDIVNNSEGVRSMTHRLTELYNKVTHSNIVEHLYKDGILYPYEFIVLQDYNLDTFLRQDLDIENLIRRGADAGIYFITYSSATPDTSMFCPIDVPAEPVDASFISVMKKSFAELVKNASTRVIRQDASTLLPRNEIMPSAGIRVPYGQLDSGEEVFFEITGEQTHHAFIIGTSGSGKSVLMHDFLVNCMVKYDPKYLQFYLLDFKMGGVELKAYHGVPHVSHLLIDGFDKRIVFEILVDLHEKMKARGERIREAGCKNLKDYNERNPNNPMQRIILVVDECHLMFERDPQDAFLQREIDSIVETIATEGRSQGVSFIFATQSLKQLDMPSKIMDNVNNRFMMNCDVDMAAQFIKDRGEKIMRNMKGRTGAVYQQSGDRIAQAYLLDGEMLNKTIAALKKLPRVQDRDEFYYEGTIKPNLDTKTLEHSRVVCGSVGKEVTTVQRDLFIKLPREEGSNILITGINDSCQSERVLFGLLASIAKAGINRGRVEVILLDNLGEDDEHEKYHNKIFDMLEDYGVTILSGNSRVKRILQLASDIRNHRVAEDCHVVLASLNHERTRRMMSRTVEADSESAMHQTSPNSSPALTGKSMFQTFNVGGGTSAYAGSNEVNVGEEFNYIVDNGGDCGIRVIIQVDRPTNIKDGVYLSQNGLESMFRSIITLKTSDNDAGALPFGNLKIERLSGNHNTLRGYCYNVEGQKYTLFTPYYSVDNVSLVPEK